MSASVLLPWENPIYAPIGAVVAIGTGEDRMADRPLRIAGGMVAAVAVAGLVVGWLGSGVWQIMVITTVTAVVGRFLFNDTLARTYSVFHGAVIAALGASRVIPEQVVEASLGAAVAIVIAHVIFPPRIEPAVLGVVERAGDRARRSLQALASALRTGEPEEMQGSLEAARQVEAYLGASDDRDKFARQLATLSPFRRSQLQRPNGTFRPTSASPACFCMRLLLPGSPNLSLWTIPAPDRSSRRQWTRSTRPSPGWCARPSIPPAENTWKEPPNACTVT